MKLSDLRILTLLHLRDPNGKDWTAAAVNVLVNAGLTTFAVDTKILRAVSRTALAANVDIYDLPTDLIELNNVVVDGRPLDNLTKTDYLVRSRTRPAGTPTAYFVWRNLLFLTPVPPADVPAGLRIFYSRRPIVLVGDEAVPEIPEEYHTALAWFAVSEGSLSDLEEARAGVYDGKYQAAVKKAKQFVDVTRDMFHTVRLRGEHPYAEDELSRGS